MNLKDHSSFNKFLRDSLDPITEVDPSTLSEYIIALLTSSGNSKKSADQLEPICVNALNEFLEQNTKDFVQKLIGQLYTINYFESEHSPKRERDRYSRDRERDRDRDRERDRDRDRERDTRERDRDRDRDTRHNYHSRSSLSRSRSRSRSPTSLSRSRSRSRSPASRQSKRDRSPPLQRRERDRDDSDNDSSSNSNSNNNNKFRKDTRSPLKRKNNTEEYNSSNGGGGHYDGNMPNKKYIPMVGGQPMARHPRFNKPCKHYESTGYCKRPNCQYIHGGVAGPIGGTFNGNGSGNPMMINGYPANMLMNDFNNGGGAAGENISGNGNSAGGNIDEASIIGYDPSNPMMNLASGGMPINQVGYNPQAHHMHLRHQPQSVGQPLLQPPPPNMFVNPNFGMLANQNDPSNLGYGQPTMLQPTYNNNNNSNNNGIDLDMMMNTNGNGLDGNLDQMMLSGNVSGGGGGMNDFDMMMNNNNNEEHHYHLRSQNPSTGGEKHNKRDKHQHQQVKTSSSCPEPTATVLIITNIPGPQNNEEVIREHFSKFGEIVKIEKLNAGQSSVEFSNNAEAQKAMKSPEAIMNNRFIKLFWQQSFNGKMTKFEENQEKQAKREEEEKKREQQLLKIKEQLLLKKLEDKKKEEKKKLAKSREELRAQQMELQKQMLLKLESTTDDKEREEIKDTINKLAKSIQESINQDTIALEQKQKEKEKEKEKQQQDQSMTSTTNNETTTNNSTPTTTTTSDTSTSASSNLEYLTATLKSLESEAKSLGIEVPANLLNNNNTIVSPVSTITTTTSNNSPKPTSPINKSIIKPSPNTLYKKPPASFNLNKPTLPYPKQAATALKHKNASMVIDNRTTTILISDPPEKFKKEDLLRSLFPDIQSVKHTDDGVEIKFQKRASAERVFLVAKSYKGSELKISWVEPNQEKKETTDSAMDENNDSSDDDDDQYDDEEDDHTEKSWKH